MKNQLELIFNNDVAYADSRVIAKYYGKRHADVMRDIRRLLSRIEEEITERNFALSNYTDSTGRKLDCYHLDFDLTMTLITGYDDKLRFQLVKDWHRMANKRNKVREEVKDTRTKFTDCLKEHGCKGYDYKNITNNMKKPLEISIKDKKGNLTEKQLRLIEAAEHVATIIIDDEYGYHECNDTCVTASKTILELAENKKKITA